MNINRKDFLTGVCATAAMPLTGLGATKPADKMIWSALLHLGSNMWDDFHGDPNGYARSRDEEMRNPNPKGPSGKRRAKYHSYARALDEVWTRTVDRAAADGLDVVFIDLGESLCYPSHPELAVPGSWSVEKMRKELARLRKLGLEPVPKCNFSATHDAWLKDYHRMVSTGKYYQVVSDIIKDVCEIFDRPRYFHIGWDEEFAGAQFNHFHTSVRRGELWWHDLFFIADLVERLGARTVMFSDMMWFNHDEYLKRMPKSILQNNWYYRDDFSEKRLKWDWGFEKRAKARGGDWGEIPNGAATYVELEKAGFDQLPCISNIFKPESVGIAVETLSKLIAPERLKGFCVAPWGLSIRDYSDLDVANGGNKWKFESRTIEGLDALAKARDTLK